MTIEQMRCELGKVYPGSKTWQRNMKTWPDYRICRVYHDFLAHDRFNHPRKPKELPTGEKYEQVRMDV